MESNHDTSETSVKNSSLSSVVCADNDPMPQEATASSNESTASPLPADHSTSNQFTFKFCPMVFSRTNCSNLHAKQHSYAKRHRCDVCGRHFSKPYHLKHHVKVHTGLNPYKCPICERPFKLLHHVQRHVRTHTGVRPYNCTFPGCGQSFEQLWQLNSHELKHLSDDDDDIGDEWFQCEWPNCHKSFSSAARLSLHVSRHRPQTGPRRRRRRRRKRKWAGPRKKPRPDNSDGNIYITADDLIGYSQDQIILEVICDGVPAIKPYLCPGCSKLCVRLDLFRRHLIACRNRLKASVKEAADALGIEPTSIPLSDDVALPAVDTPE